MDVEFRGTWPASVPSIGNRYCTVDGRLLTLGHSPMHPITDITTRTLTPCTVFDPDAMFTRGQLLEPLESYLTSYIPQSG